MKLLEVDKLSLSFKTKLGENQVLKNIAFSLNRSETLGIVGESGSRKSLTALSIINLLPKNAIISSGKIIYKNDVNILELSEKELLTQINRNMV